MRKFSIILPVRNGGNYVKECVNSILSQQYPHFNLIILDNASTDGTSEWISSLQDERVIVYPSKASLSIEDNWARIKQVSRNEFMTCIGHDDILSPGYLDEMNSLINEFPDASLYQSHFVFIDAQGKMIRPCIPMEQNQHAPAFLRDMLLMQIDVNGTGFMIRSNNYDKIGGIPHYPNLLFADLALWLEACRLSYKITSNKNCFSYRLHQSMTTTSSDNKFHEAIEMLVSYLGFLKRKDTELGQVIDQYASVLLSYYCKSFAHRLLRTGLDRRGHMLVKDWVKKCDHFHSSLLGDKKGKPSDQPSVKLAMFIDSNPVTRNLFRVFRKVYSKPLLK
jgi:glycosyltransferase involved in cell wall biosynthesis